MSKDNEEVEGVFKKFFNKFRSKGDKKPDKLSNEDYENNDISDLQGSAPNPPKRLKKKNAPLPPIDPTAKQSSTMDQSKYPVNNSDETGMSQMKVDEFNAMFAKLSIRVDSEPQIVTKSVSENSQLKKKIQRSKSSIEKKRSDAVPKIHHNLIDFSDDENLNIINNCQIQKNLEENDIGRTVSQNVDHKKISVDILNSKPTKAEIGKVEIKSQKSPKSDESTIKIKNHDSEKNNTISGNLKLDKNINQSEVKCNSLPVLEDGGCKLENQKINLQKEDETNKSLNKEIENKKESSAALKQINCVMEEVKNIELDIQNLNNSEEIFVIESGLTNAMIKLDGIQTSKNELVKQERKKGIITIQELFKLLDKQIKENQS